MKRKFLVLGLVALLASCAAPAASGPASIEGKGAPSADIGTMGAVYTDTISGVSYRKTILGWVVIDRAVVGTSESGQEPASSQSSQADSQESSQSSSQQSPQTSQQSSTSQQTSQTTGQSTSQATSQSGQTSSEYSYQPSSSTYDWKVDLGTYGQTFMKSLSTQIQDSGTTASYARHRTILPKIQGYPNEGSPNLLPFYHCPADNKLIAASDFNTESGWNREHTWPKHHGGGQIEDDPIVIRAAAKNENGNRQHYFYDEVKGRKYLWDPACGWAGARGESARVILYAAVCYYNVGLTLSSNVGDSDPGNKKMGTLKTLLAWNAQYPPEDWEKTVNDRFDKNGYRRNPFVDHPEYASYIFDDNGVRTTPYNPA